MEPKDVFMQKMAAVVQQIPADALDEEVYSKFAKDYVGGTYAGRVCVETMDDLQGQLAIARQVKEAASLRELGSQGLNWAKNLLGRGQQAASGAAGKAKDVASQGAGKAKEVAGQGVERAQQAGQGVMESIGSKVRNFGNEQIPAANKRIVDGQPQDAGLIGQARGAIGQQLAGLSDAQATGLVGGGAAAAAGGGALLATKIIRSRAAQRAAQRNMRLGIGAAGGAAALGAGGYLAS